MLLEIDITKSMDDPRTENEFQKLLQSNQKYNHSLASLQIEDGVSSVTSLSRPIQNKNEVAINSLSFPLKRLYALGRGSSSIVYKSIKLTNLQLCAEKVLQCTKAETILREIEFLKSICQFNDGNNNNIPPRTCDSNCKTISSAASVSSTSTSNNTSSCPYIVQLYDVYNNPDDGTLSLCLEYMNYGSLQDIVNLGGCCNESILSSMTYQILQGIHYLHTLRIMHRDIKPSNILLNQQGQIKLSDFGIAQMLEIGHSLADSFIGTFEYMAPERLTGEPYSFQSDIWSFGLTMFTVAMGKFPYYNTGNQKAQKGFWDLMQIIQQDHKPLPPSTMFSSDFVDFVGITNRKDMKQRPSAMALFGHSFLKAQLAIMPIELWEQFKESLSLKRHAQREKLLSQTNSVSNLNDKSNLVMYSASMASIPEREYNQINNQNEEKYINNKENHGKHTKEGSMINNSKLRVIEAIRQNHHNNYNSNNQHPSRQSSSSSSSQHRKLLENKPLPLSNLQSASHHANQIGQDPTPRTSRINPLSARTPLSSRQTPVTGSRPSIRNNHANNSNSYFNGYNNNAIELQRRPTQPSSSASSSRSSTRQSNKQSNSSNTATITATRTTTKQGKQSTGPNKIIPKKPTQAPIPPPLIEVQPSIIMNTTESLFSLPSASATTFSMNMTMTATMRSEKIFTDDEVRNILISWKNLLSDMIEQTLQQQQQQQQQIPSASQTSSSLFSHPPMPSISSSSSSIDTALILSSLTLSVDTVTILAQELHFAHPEKLNEWIQAITEELHSKYPSFFLSLAHFQSSSSSSSSALSSSMTAFPLPSKDSPTYHLTINTTTANNNDKNNNIPEASFIISPDTRSKAINNNNHSDDTHNRGVINDAVTPSSRTTANVERLQEEGMRLSCQQWEELLGQQLHQSMRISAQNINMILSSQTHSERFNGQEEHQDDKNDEDEEDDGDSAEEMIEEYDPEEEDEEEIDDQDAILHQSFQFDDHCDPASSSPTAATLANEVVGDDGKGGDFMRRSGRNVFQQEGRTDKKALDTNKEGLKCSVVEDDDDDDVEEELASHPFSPVRSYPRTTNTSKNNHNNQHHQSSDCDSIPDEEEDYLSDEFEQYDE